MSVPTADYNSGGRGQPAERMEGSAESLPAPPPISGATGKTVAGGAGDELDFLNIHRLLENLWRWKIMLASLTALGMVLAVFLAANTPSMYRTTARVQLTAGRPQFNPLDPYSIPFYDHLRWIETQKEIVGSEKMLSSAFEAMAGFDEFKGLDREQAVARMQTHLTTRILEDTNLLEITYISRYQDEAAPVLRNIVEAYIDMEMTSQLRTEEDQYDQLKHNIESQLRLRENKIAERRRYIDNLKKKGIDFAGELQDTVSNLLTRSLELQRRMDELEQQAIEHKRNVEGLKSAELNKKLGVVRRLNPNPWLEQQQSVVSEKKEHYELLRMETSPSYQELEAARTSYEKAKAEYERFISDLIQQHLGAQENELAKVIDKKAKVQARLDNVNENLRKLAPHYDSLRQTDEEIAQIDEDLKWYRSELNRFSPKSLTRHNEFNIIDKPYRPDAPFAPDFIKYSLVGGFLGFILAIGLLQMFTLWDVSIKNREDLMRQARIFPLGLVPHHPRLNRDYLLGELPAGDSMTLQVLESYQIIWTTLKARLVPADREHGVVITVSSAVPKEGKSTAVANLAYIIARNGERVLVIDADMRRSALSLQLGNSSEVGLDACLQRTVARDKVTVSTSVPNLDLLPAGKPSHRPTELLTSSALDSLLLWARNRYDVIFLDTPPMLTFADAMMVAQKSDGVVTVINGGRTNKSMVNHVRELCESMNVNLLGGVLNDCTGALAKMKTREYNSAYPTYNYYYGGKKK